MKKLICLLLVMVVAGCSATRYVTVPECHTRDSIVTRWRLDSVVLHDSIFQAVRTAGDTVFSEKYVFRNMARQLLRVDTLKVEHRDTVTLYMPAQATTDGHDSEPAWYYRAAIRFTITALLCGIAVMVAWIVKFRKKT